MPKNPPAFPRPASEYTKSGTLADGNDAIREQDGMTLRDWFAGMAIMGLLAHNPERNVNVEREAFDYADGMLTQRERTDA
jgi:hypothetical protein